jgi:mannose-6-phosphate isomerase-like protein (cupin superfamily)
MIIDGLGVCFYPVLESLSAPPASACRKVWHDGARLGFGFVELLQGACDASDASPHEQFLYVVRGTAQVTVGSERRRVRVGDVIEIPIGAKYQITVSRRQSICFAATRSTHALEAQLRRRRAPAPRATARL